MAPNPASKKGARRALSLTMTALLLSLTVLAPAASALGDLPVEPYRVVGRAINDIRNAIPIALPFPPPCPNPIIFTHPVYQSTLTVEGDFASYDFGLGECVLHGYVSIVATPAVYIGGQSLSSTTAIDLPPAGNAGAHLCAAGPYQWSVTVDDFDIYENHFVSGLKYTPAGDWYQTGPTSSAC